MLERSLQTFRALRSEPWTFGHVLKTISLLVLDGGNPFEAIRLYGGASAALAEYGLSADVMFQLDEREMTAAVQVVGDAADSPWTIGRSLSIAEATALALRLLAEGPAPASVSSHQPVSTTADPFGLTGRERDVLRLLANGRSDREIARALSISPHTVHGHVSNLLGKLGVTSRTAAAVLAQRQGLA